MIKAEGVFLQQTAKASYAGKVIMQILPAMDNTVEIEYSLENGNGMTPIYSDWIEGVRIGAQFALNQYNKTPYKVRIIEIIGTDLDSNPTILGTATILGIWKALKMNIDSNQYKKLIRYTLSSWNNNPRKLPYYDIIL